MKSFFICIFPRNAVHDSVCKEVDPNGYQLNRVSSWQLQTFFSSFYSQYQTGDANLATFSGMCKQ